MSARGIGEVQLQVLGSGDAFGKSQDMLDHLAEVEDEWAEDGQVVIV
ncbi:MAG: hypothetical protein HY726_08740 [Candidatus Rokubacteria bacterium]|nr:hypothetical protein [Candidatus Rokubacteria bacterium]